MSKPRENNLVKRHLKRKSAFVFDDQKGLGLATDSPSPS